MSTIVTCPECSRQLRVREELLGKKVKCPGCETIFTATASEGAAPPEDEPAPRRRPPVDEDEGADEERVTAHDRPRAEDDDEGDRPRRPRDDDDSEDMDDEPRPRRRRSAKNAWGKVVAPAICMLIVASLGVLGNAYYVVSALVVDPDEVRAQALQQQKRQMDQMNPQEKKTVEGIADWTVFLMTGPVGAGVFGCFLLLNAVIVLGSVMMIRGKAYGLAMLSTILSMLNIWPCCCILGLPFGIWGLVILFQADVKQGFN